jgi:AmmeMemoRadiSam system protein A
MAYAYTLADDEKRELLRIARATLKEYLVSGRIPPGAPHRASMCAPAGVFVSLHGPAAEGSTAPGDLRGCVGQVAETAPLYKAIQEMTIAAASRDPRFKPVATEELPRLTIEISVLGERRRVRSPDEVQIGRDGLSISAFGRRGLLLPKVAEEHGWSGEIFLAKVCEKAGLPPEAWRDPEAVVEAFSAQVFDEKAHPPMSAVLSIKR